MTNSNDRAARQQAENSKLTRALTALGGAPPVTPEWEAILALVRGGWPGNMSDSEALAYPALLSDLDTGKILAAIRQLHQDGARFRPRPSEVRALIAPAHASNSKLPAPNFDAAWAYITRSGQRSSWDEDRADAWLARHAHPAVHSWARLRGIKRLWHQRVDCPDHGTIIRRDLRTDWNAHSRDWSDPANRPALTRLSDSLAHRNALSGPRKLKALGTLKPPAAPGPDDPPTAA